MTDRGDPVLEMHDDQAFRSSAMVGRYLSAFFERLNENKIRYCVLHSYEDLPAYAPSDVDMAVASADLQKAETVLFEVSDSLGFKVIQKLYYDIPRCYYYVVFFRDDVGNPGFVQLDFLNDDSGIGRYSMRTATLLQGRRQYNGFYVPSVPVEACYLLIKKVIKGAFSPEHEAKLRTLLDEDGTAVTEMIVRYFGRECRSDVHKLIRGAGPSDRADIIERLQEALTLHQGTFKPHLRVLSILWLTRRVLERILRPTGLVTVFVSPDGGGKSTVADLVLHRLRYGFRNVKKMHWRPCLLPPPRKLFSPAKWNEPEAPNYDPHNLPPKGKAGSVARFLYYFCDYALGYAPKALWPKIRTHLVVFERYYYDFLIDTRRFRLAIPSWLPRVFLPFVPKGDIIFVLSGPAEVLYERKQEIPLEEIRRQLDAIDRFSAGMRHVCRVRVDQPIADEVSRIEDAIVEALEKRLRKRVGRPFHG